MNLEYSSPLYVQHHWYAWFHCDYHKYDIHRDSKRIGLNQQGINTNMGNTASNIKTSIENGFSKMQTKWEHKIKIPVFYPRMQGQNSMKPSTEDIEL